jgi:CheY-like chemotaxis protein
MQMPDTSLDNEEIGEASYSESTSNPQGSPESDRAITPLEAPFSPSGRKRARIEETDSTTVRPSKRSPMFAEAAMAQAVDSNCSRSIDSSSSRRVSKKISACNELSPPPRSQSLRPSNSAPSTPRLALSDTLSSEQSYVNIRPFLVGLLSESVRNSHPTNVVTAPIKGGETIRLTMERPRAQICFLLITIIVDDDVPERIVSNEQHLGFAIRKVVDNAIKFSYNTQSGRIDISAKLSRNGLLLEIRVKDTGCGINEQSKEQLFTPHFQQDASTTRSHDGLGLSLFNAKALLRKHLRGDMALVASSVEYTKSGSEFLIRFPISASHEGGRFSASLLGTPTFGATPAASGHGSPSPPPPGNVSTIAGPTTDLSQAKTNMRSSELSSLDGKAFDYKTLANRIPLKFLVAEDNPLNRDVLAKLLRKLGYEAQNVLLACDGLEAVEHYEASLLDPSDHIDIILMDLWMPSMDGYQATRKIFDMTRKSGHAPIVIAVTADITRQSRDKALEAGMADFISKPYTMADLQRLIIKHFGEGEKEG